jgi:RimJ/RimL family protein N-acetyltransferase
MAARKTGKHTMARSKTRSVNQRKVKVERLQDRHLPMLWDIIRTFPGYFKCDSYNLFLDEYETTPKIGLIALRKNELIGCSYIKFIHNGLAEISIIFKRRTLKPSETLFLALRGLKYFFRRFRFKMIYAVTDATNFPCLKLLQKLGFVLTHDLGRGQVMASILRRSV